MSDEPISTRRRTKRLAERCFCLRLDPAITVGIEQRLARGEDGALAVMVHGATL